jgi:hypothetical protein
MVPQKPQVWSSCKAHDAMEWQRHFERHATPQMGRNCGFWVEPPNHRPPRRQGGQGRELLHLGVLGVTGDLAVFARSP